MRAALLGILLAALVLGTGGCGLFDMMLDAGYESVKKWGKEALPVLKSDLFKEVEALADDTLEKAKAYAREKTASTAELILTKVEVATGVPAPTADPDRSWREEFGAFKKWWADVQLENQRRREENDPDNPPMPWYQQFLIGAGGAVGVIGARWASKRDQDRRIGGYLRNLGLAGNGKRE